MTVLQLFEVALAAALVLAGIYLYRRRGRADGSRGSQTAVILIVIGLIVGIHGFGMMEYRPSAGEMARIHSQGQGQ